MIASAHVAAGAVVGALAMRIRVPGIVRAFIAAVAGVSLHLAMDAIPHSDYAFIPFGRIPWVGLGEALVACGVVFWMSRGRIHAWQRFVMFTAVAGSMAPDVKFVARVLAPQYERTITRLTDTIHGFHATQPLHVFVVFTGEAILALGLVYLFRRLITAGAGQTRDRSTAEAVRPSAS